MSFEMQIERVKKLLNLGTIFEFPQDRPVVQRDTEASVMDISAFRGPIS